MELIASYVVGSGGSNANTLTTPTFTPSPGELIVVKAGNEDDDNPSLTGVSGGGLVWAAKAAWLQGEGNYSDAWIYTGKVGLTPAAMTVASTWSSATEGTGVHAMIVERWTGATVATSPASNPVRTGNGTPSVVVTATAPGSAVTWVDVDWNAIAGTPAARGTDGDIFREFTPGGSYLTPIVSARGSGQQLLDSVQHPIVVPPHGSGDLLTVTFSSDGTSAVTVPADSGWAVAGTTTQGTAHTSTLLWKSATGADDLVITTAAAEQSTHVSHVIENWELFEFAMAKGAATATGGSTTTTATITGRTTGMVETAAASHTVTLPAGVAAGEAALVLFNNDTATATATTSAAGWVALDTQTQGTTTNLRGTLFYAANAATAAALVVNLSAAEEASWASFRIAGGGTPVFLGTNGSGTTVTGAALSGMTLGDYTALLLVGVDSSTDTALNQTITWPAGWATNPQTRRPAVASTTTAPEVFTVERRFTAITGITPGTITLSLTEQVVEFTVAIPDVTTTSPAGAGTATPANLAPAAGGTPQRLWMSTLSLDTGAAAGPAQTLTVPGGFGNLNRSNGTGTATALTATAETTAAVAAMTPPPWAMGTAEDWVCWTIAVTGSLTGGSGAMRMFAGANVNAAALAGSRVVGMTAPTGQAWTLVAIELLPEPVSATLGTVDELEEPQPITAGRVFALGTVTETEELPALDAVRSVAGPLLGLMDEVEEIPDLVLTRLLPALGTVDEIEELPVQVLSRVLFLDVVEEIEELPDARGGGTMLSPIEMAEEVPPLTVGFGGISVASSPARRGLPPVVFRGGIRVMAQNIITGRWVHRELPVSDLQITRTLSGPQVISGTFAHEVADLHDVNLMPWGSWIHVEQAGDIRASGILLPGSYDSDGKLELTAQGVSAYAARIPYTGEFRAIEMDPAEIVRTLWAQMQSFPRGNLGVTVAGSTPVRMGKPETVEVKDETIVAKKEAAQDIIDAMQSGETVYEDWTWPDCPDVVNQYNDELIAGFQKAYAGQSQTVLADGNITRATYKEMALEISGSLDWATSNGEPGYGYDWTADYGTVNSLADARGYVGGIASFSSSTGAMLALVQAYGNLSPNNTLTPYITALTTLTREGPSSTSVARADALLGQAFRTAWDQATGQATFRKAQRSERDRQFWNPALAQAQADGVGPLGLAIHYDTIVSHGPGAGVSQYGGILATARAAATPPAQGGTQAAYLTALLNARAASVTLTTQAIENSAVATYRELLTGGNVALSTPFTWHNAGFTTSLAAPPTDPEVSPTASGAPTLNADLAITWLRDNILTLDEVTTPAGTPWVLHGYELPLVGATIDQLGEETPFEYLEEQGWVDATKEAVWHRIRIGYPRIGSRLDLNLTQGENLLEHAPFEEPDDAYADSVFVTGKGEGADGVYGYAGVEVPSRLRLPRIVTDKTIATQALATARAHEEVAAALSTVEEITEVAINVRHPNSLWGTFDIGDEILPRIRLPWLGQFAQWHRITQLTYAPDAGYATCKLSRRDAYRSR